MTSSGRGERERVPSGSEARGGGGGGGGRCDSVTVKGTEVERR